MKANCATKNIGLCVIPGGLTSYLQAGDIGIYKVFKELLYEHFDIWKSSDDVTCTKAGKPYPPPVSTFSRWVRKMWEQTGDDVVANSAAPAAFARDYREWHVANHDAYGRQSVQAWNKERVEQSGDDIGIDLIANALDEAIVIDQ